MATTYDRSPRRSAKDTTVRSTVWSPARLYLTVTGLVLVTAAAAGFAVTASFPDTASAVHSADSGHIFGIFETNGWHNLSTLISGMLSLGFALKPEWARAGALFKGTLYAIVTVSIAVWGPETFLIVSNTADQIAHGSLAVTAFAAALATRRA